jgi:hypothetical protein
MEMKKSLKVFFGACLVIGLVITLTGCWLVESLVSGKLENSFGKTVPELKEMIGKTPDELENLTGRKLQQDGATYSASDYPKAGVKTLFTTGGNQKVNAVTIRFTNNGKSGALAQFAKLSKQTMDKFGNAKQVEPVNGKKGFKDNFWDIGEGFSILMPSSYVTETGIVDWILQKK